MRHLRKLQWAAVCLVALALAAAAVPRGGRAQATTYVVTDLGALGNATSQSKAFGVNLCATVVGETAPAAPASQSLRHPFRWSGGTMTDLETFGGNNGTAWAVNDYGNVVGYAETSSDRRAFFWKPGAGKLELGTLGGDSSAANALNNHDQVVGDSDVPGPAGAVGGRGFVWDSANGMRAVPTLGGDTNSALAINNNGQIVGYSETANGVIHAFLLTGETPTDLGTLPGGGRSFARAVNDAGVVVGESTLATDTAQVPYHGFYWSAQTGMLDMGTLGGFRSIAYDINNSGQAVGQSEVAPGVVHAFVYTQAGGMSDLNQLVPNSGWTFEEARSINDNGQIVGFGTNPDGHTHAFLLTPEGVTPPNCLAPTPTPSPTPPPTPTPSPSPTPAPSPTPVLVNVALASRGATATASSTLDAGRTAAATINGDRRGVHWGTDPATGSGWHDATANAFPDWLEVSFNGTHTLYEVNVFSVQDAPSAPVEPTLQTIFTKYGATAMHLEAWNGAAWQPVPGASLTGNNKVWAKLSFAPVTTSKIRVFIDNGLAGHSRLIEVEAWAAAPRVNHALTARGSTAAASSTLDAGRSALATVNGDRRGVHWGTDPATGSGWHDATANAFPDWVEVTFPGPRWVDEVNVFSVQDAPSAPVEPTLQTIFTKYGATGLQIEYWDGATWQTAPNGLLAGNNKVWARFTFAPLQTTKVRVLVNNGLAGHSRLTEVEAWGADLSSTPPPPPRVNHAAAANGATAAASSTLDAGRSAPATINGDRRGIHWGTGPTTGSGWHDSTNNTYPDWLEVSFSGTKSVTEVSVFGLQDNYTAPSEPTEAQTFTKYGLIDFDVEYWTGTAWTVVPGGQVVGNNKVWRKVTFAALNTTKIRILVRKGAAGHSRIVEVEAY